MRPITQQVASLVDRLCGVGGRSATISTVDTQSGELQLLELKRRFYTRALPADPMRSVFYLLVDFAVFKSFLML